MAGNLNKTKHRIASINSTKKITKAMELVSTVKLKKFKNVMLKNELYSNELKSLTCTLFSRLDDEENKYTKLNDAEKDLLIVVSSNLGLCAGYNNDIYHYVEQNFDKNEVVIIPIGMKGDSYFKKNGFALNEEFVLLNEKINYLDITRLGKTVLSYFENKKYRSIKLVYTKYVNSIKFVPNTLSLFPLEIENVNDSTLIEPLYDPDLKTLIDNLVPLYVNINLYQKIVESQVCEQASRRNAMENATDNADELISTLTLEYNKARQAQITQEISEVIAGQK
ncbi:MAG: ATP synthase F1 subunit gamma [Erysipelotrichaceae bacterium]|nr:ATP synthase F1 subunit gamma [Erysipelotrichaceae bacterium]